MIIKEAKGQKVPALGFGTYELNGEKCVQAVEHALEIGYRHLDTARGYENEKEVGRAIRNSKLPREELFVVTKIPREDLSGAAVRDSLWRSLDELNLDFVDLVLVHWPNPEIPLAETLEALQRLQENGSTKHFGVSNFTCQLLRQAADIAPIFCNQVEYHTLLGQDKLLEVVAEKDMLLTAYSPLAKGDAVTHPVIEEIGKKYGKTAGQVALRWLVQQERVVAIPRSASAKHRVTNFQIFDFELSREDMRIINALPKDERHVVPPWAPVWD